MIQQTCGQLKIFGDKIRSIGSSRSFFNYFIYLTSGTGAKGPKDR